MTSHGGCAFHPVSKQDQGDQQRRRIEARFDFSSEEYRDEAEEIRSPRPPARQHIYIEGVVAQRAIRSRGEDLARAPHTTGVVSTRSSQFAGMPKGHGVLTRSTCTPRGE